MLKSNGRFVVGVLVACAGVVGSVHAQDSTSLLGSVGAGDALVPWDASLQRVSYVVDLSPFSSSWGNEFAIAPLMKSSQTSANFNNSLLSAQFVSKDLLTGVPYLSSNYAIWENAPGVGINPDPQRNMPAGTVAAPGGSSHQFSAVVAEYSTSGGGFNYNGNLGAVVNYDPAQPARLYVTRIVGAVNTADMLTGDSAQFGIGSVDAHGNMYFRSDAFGVAGSPGLPNVAGNNLFGVALPMRGAVVNQINGNTSLHDATTNLLINSAVNHGPPAHIPQSLAGAATVATAHFQGLYARGTGVPLTTDASHFAPGVTDHRGSFGMTTQTVLGSGVATFGVLARGADNRTLGMNVWSVNAAGDVLNSQAYFAPVSVTDIDDGFSVTYTGTSYEFGQYRSQTGFRGGTGQVAVGQTRSGNGLLAATMHENGLMNDFSNQILVCEFNPSTGASTWTIAAYIDQAFLSGRSGKEVFDGNGNVIGVLTPLFNVTGGQPLGPSISSPAIDAAGNVWFLGAVELFDRLPGGGSDFDSALFRAVRDDATGGYRLELILELGQVFSGLNSGTDYQIRFLEIADNDSVSSGTVFSGNVASHTWANTPLSSLSNDDPRTNGGFVLQASIVYRAPDGSFDTSAGAQQYNALLFIGVPNPEGPVPCNPADFAEPYGQLDFFDVQAFLQAFSAQNPAADLNGDGAFDFFDVQLFLQFFSAGCP